LNTNGQYGKFSLGAKVLYSHEKANNRPVISDSPGNAPQGVYRIPPSINVNDYKGDPNKPGAIYTKDDGTRVYNPGAFTDKIDGEELLPWTSQWLQNPWWSAYQYEHTDVRNRVIGSAIARYDITDWLFAHIRVGTDWQIRRDRRTTPYGTSYNRLGNIDERLYNIREDNYEWMAGVNKIFGDIGLNAFVGGNKMIRSSETFRLYSSSMNIPFFMSVTNGSNQSYNLWYNKSGINSLFGSVELSYGGFIYLTATAREDWFSTLNPETNNILYPSFGVSYVFSDMFTLPAWWTAGKVRASWAQVGGATSAYKTSLTYRLDPAHNGYPQGFITQSSIPNPDLKPLTSTEWEVGFDVRFFENRLGLDFTYYNQLTTDDILDASISESSGFGATTVNIGEMENSGIEFLLTANPVRGDFNWDVSFNIAHNTSNVISLGSGLDRLYVNEPRTRWAFIYHAVGEPYSSIYGFTHNSIGGQKMYDTGGGPVPTDTISLIGNAIHPVTGGITNTLTWKNFVLSFLIDFKLGGDIYSGTNARLISWGYHQMTLEGRDPAAEKTVSGVDSEGAPFNYTIPWDEINGYWYDYSRCSEYMMYDASFFKLRQLTLGYNLPQSILDRTPFTYVNLSFVGRNLALLWDKMDNVDPESMYRNSNDQGFDYFGLPHTKSYGFNLRVRF
jgi:outer membrane receptor protein involved in Fe transport